MRHLLFFLLIGSTLTLPVATQAQTVLHDTIATRCQLPAADCALFPAAATFPLHKVGDIFQVGMRRFTPTRAQVATTEQALRTVDLQQVSYRYEPTTYYDGYPTIIKKHLASYKRQYYGFYDSKRHPCLFINFFIENPEELHAPLHWLQYPVRVYDGGWAFWSIYYNLTTKKFLLYEHGGEG